MPTSPVVSRLLVDLLTWLDDYPADQVDPDAVAAVRPSLLPADQPDPTSLKLAAGLLVDLMRWPDTCEEYEVDSHVVVKLQKAGGVVLDELPDEQQPARATGCSHVHRRRSGCCAAALVVTP